MMKSPRTQIAQIANRLLTLGRRSLPLTVRAEGDVLVQADDIFATCDTAAMGPGATSHLVYGEFYPKERVAEWLAGRAGGSPLPDWASGHDGVLRGGVQLSRASETWYVPRFGAVIGPHGEVFKSTIAEALYFTPTLAGLPHVRLDASGAARFYPPAGMKRIPRATVFASWGGLHNYGHFLLDCLPALWASATRGALQDYPPVAPPLNGWQANMVKRLLGSESEVVSIPDDIVEIEDVVFCSSMDHFLHTPNHPLNLIRYEMLSRGPSPDPDLPRRIYLTRESDPKRRMVNEASLHAALETRGFAVINPAQLSIDEQISIFNQAEIVISATGAGLANALFAGEVTKIFELFPSNFPGIWVRNLCFLLGIDWFGFVSPSPIEEHLITIEGEVRPGVEFTWRLMLPEFLSFLDERI